MKTLILGLACCMFLVTTEVGAQQYSGRTTKVGSSTYYYGASGRYTGRTTQVGRQSFYYGASGSYQGRAAPLGRSTFYYGNYPR